MCGLFRNLAPCKQFRKLVKDSLEMPNASADFSKLLLADGVADDSLLAYNDVDLAFDLLGFMHTLW